MNDQLILELVKTLDEEILDVESEKNGYQYFKVEPVFPASTQNHPYRLVLMICVQDDYIGVINAFRVNQR